jgi:hypothetical protein
MQPKEKQSLVQIYARTVTTISGGKSSLGLRHRRTVSTVHLWGGCAEARTIQHVDARKATDNYASKSTMRTAKEIGYDE